MSPKNITNNNFHFLTDSRIGAIFVITNDKEKLTIKIHYGIENYLKYISIWNSKSEKLKGQKLPYNRVINYLHYC